MKHYKNDPDLNAEINAIVASELATLRAENEKLREALQPFAILADVKFCGEWRDDESVMHTDIAHKFTFGLIRAAREALKLR